MDCGTILGIVCIQEVTKRSHIIIRKVMNYNVNGYLNRTTFVAHICSNIINCDRARTPDGSDVGTKVGGFVGSVVGI